LSPKAPKYFILNVLSSISVHFSRRGCEVRSQVPNYVSKFGSWTGTSQRTSELRNELPNFETNFLKPVFHFNCIVAKRSVFLCFLTTRVELMTSTQKKMLRYVTIRLKWKTGLSSIDTWCDICNGARGTDGFLRKYRTKDW
jgi:hypothetical protein